MEKKSIATLLAALSQDAWSSKRVCIRRIEDDEDLWYAVAECKIRPEQEEFINPAGFSLGRAYLAPDDNVPCVICKEDGARIGFIVFREWLGADPSLNWSYYVDRSYQGKGYGKEAAKLATQILRSADPAMPIKLSTEAANSKAQRLYQSLGFTKSDILDGDDLVYVLRSVNRLQEVPR